MITPISRLTSLAYKIVLKPIYFKLDPEIVHILHVDMGKRFGNNVLIKSLIKIFWAYQDPRLHKKLDGILFKNPVGLSAGFDYNAELTQVLPSLGFGFHTIGTITFRPYAGNPKPRLKRLINSKSLIVNKGLKNYGAQAIANKLEKLNFEIPVGISIASTNMLHPSLKHQLLDIVSSFVIFEKSKVKHSYYEMNISCPNTFGGEPFTNPSRLSILLKTLDKLNLSRPLYLKMPIDQSEAETLSLLKVADKHNVQGVIFGNLSKDKKNPDLTDADRETWLKSKGNLSGKPTWARSNKAIQLTKENFPNRFTIIGTGGIFDEKDALIKIQLGADLVQLISGMIFNGPQKIGQINQFLASKQLEFETNSV